MKFYSEILDKLFDTQEELELQETEEKAKEVAKKEAYDAVLEAAKARDEAQANYESVRDAYVKKYGAIAICQNNGKYFRDNHKSPLDLLFNSLSID